MSTPLVDESSISRTLALIRPYRRERGLEMLTTLLDASAPGQRWPAALDAVDIIVRGLRRRLLPPHPLYFLVLVPVSLFVAFTGATFAVWQTLDVLAPIPSDATAVAVARTATDQVTRNVPGPPLSCNDVYCWDEEWKPDGDQVIPENWPLCEGDNLDKVAVGYWVDDADKPAFIDDARRRLAAAGWQLSRLDVQRDGSRYFNARNRQLQLYVTAPVGLPRSGLHGNAARADRRAEPDAARDSGRERGRVPGRAGDRLAADQLGDPPRPPEAGDLDATQHRRMLSRPRDQDLGPRGPRPPPLRGAEKRSDRGDGSDEHVLRRATQCWPRPYPKPTERLAA